MLAECEVPCGLGGTDHLILPFYICMCYGEASLQRKTSFSLLETFRILSSHVSVKGSYDGYIELLLTLYNLTQRNYICKKKSSLVTFCVFGNYKFMIYNKLMSLFWTGKVKWGNLTNHITQHMNRALLVGAHLCYLLMLVEKNGINAQIKPKWTEKSVYRNWKLKFNVTPDKMRCFGY